MESSSSTSSIGRNSDNEYSFHEGDEVNSNLKEGALHSLQELEQVLPIKYKLEANSLSLGKRRSLSQFHDGKTKSFNNLKDAEATSSIQEIAKPENAYARRRKNLLAHHCFSERNPLGVRRGNGGISKSRAKVRNMSTLAPTMGRSENSSNGDGSNTDSTYIAPSMSDLESVAPDPKPYVSNKN